MSEWTLINQPEDPDWREWHKEVMSPALGRVMLKLWVDDGYRFSASFPRGARATGSIGATSDDEAKDNLLLLFNLAQVNICSSTLTE